METKVQGLFLRKIAMNARFAFFPVSLDLIFSRMLSFDVYVPVLGEHFIEDVYRNNYSLIIEIKKASPRIDHRCVVLPIRAGDAVQFAIVIAVCCVLETRVNIFQTSL